MRRNILLSILFLFSALLLHGQSNDHNGKLGEVYFSKKAYLSAIPHLRKAIHKDTTNCPVIVKLALCYYYTRQLEKAEKAFNYLQQQKQLNDTIVPLYVDVLKQLNRYLIAKDLVQSYKKGLYKELALHCDSAIYWLRNKVPVKIENLEKLNSESSETGPGIHPQGLYFLSNRESVIIEKKTGSDGLPYSDAYLSKYTKDSLLGGPAMYGPLSNVLFHAGPAYFTPDEHKTYYTRAEKDKDNVLRSKLYLMEGSGANSSQNKLFIFNDSLYSFMHPFLDKDEKLFFFCSDMPGGYGGTDLYVSVNVNDHWSSPINLGPVINTPYNELLPFYDLNGRLFYSSNRPEGMGGYDIYVAHQKKGLWTRSQNLRSPVNSPNDDLGFVLTHDYKTAYTSSNREGGVGREDLYKVSGDLFRLFDE